jgi:hypothetical protein
MEKFQLESLPNWGLGTSVQSFTLLIADCS